MKLSFTFPLLLVGTFVTGPVSSNTGNVSPSAPMEWQFRVFLDDREIGFHNFTVQQDRDIQRVQSTARFDVKLLFFTAYSYEHNNMEQWHGECLAKIDATTNDNGKRLYVSGEATESGFRVETADSRRMHQSCIRTFAYWDPSLLDAPRLLNSQTGELEDIEANYIGAKKMDIHGEQTTAHHYRLSGDELLIDLWYSDENHWLALESLTPNGSRIRYQMK